MIDKKEKNVIDRSLKKERDIDFINQTISEFIDFDLLTSYNNFIKKSEMFYYICT